MDQLWYGLVAVACLGPFRTPQPHLRSPSSSCTPFPSFRSSLTHGMWDSFLSYYSVCHSSSPSNSHTTVKSWLKYRFWSRLVLILRPDWISHLYTLILQYMYGNYKHMVICMITHFILFSWQTIRTMKAWGGMLSVLEIFLPPSLAQSKVIFWTSWPHKFCFNALSI